MNGIIRGFQHYQVTPGSVLGASVQAAAAKAAYTALVALFPTQQPQFDALLASSLGSIPPGQSKDDGIAWGQSVATAILAARASDGSDDNPPYTPGTDPGDWQPTPPAGAAGVIARMGRRHSIRRRECGDFCPVRPAGSRQPGVCRRVQRGEGTRRFNQRDANRGPDGDRPILGRWGGDIYSPWTLERYRRRAGRGGWAVALANRPALCPARYCRRRCGDCLLEDKIQLRVLAAGHGDSLADSDGNDLTIQDDTWVPLLTTPPFPEYTSGHSTFSGAASTVLAAYFGANRAFSTDSNDGSITRSFNSFAAAADEAGKSRIYGGIHFQSANEDGLSSGRSVGAYVLANLLQSR